MVDDMEERYPGEHLSLSRFLESVESAIGDVLGEDNMLGWAIRRALRLRKLSQLRHARDLFNQLPRPLRDQLSSHLIERQDQPDERTDHVDDSVAIIRFETSISEPGVHISRRVPGPKAGGPPPRDIAVDIHSDILPSAAASRLRLIAGSIEAKKELLSKRHWQHRPRRDRS